MIEKYFSGYKNNEVELSVEIKRCLIDYILKKSENIFYLIEFHDFELTPKKVFEFTDFDLYCAFVGSRWTFRPRLLIEKNENFFVEFNGNEIQAGFELVNQEIKIDIWHIMPLGRAS